MPHCIIEHARTIDSQRLMRPVHAGALESGLFSPDGADIKVRAIACDHYLTGGRQADFVHVTLRILSGRTAAQKQALAAKVLGQLAALGLGECALTVEVVDMDRASYAKRTPGTPPAA
jgi:5-carboxymethyl-2-hydroxymuconate isomerase